MATTAARNDYEAPSKRQRYERLRQTLWLERNSFDASWRELAQFVSPVRPRFVLTDRNRGDRRNQSIIDSTGTQALHVLQSGLHAGLTSPARPWMKLVVPDPALNKIPSVKQWLFDVTERMHVIFQLSNLYNALPVLYGDMGLFGTGAMGVLDDFGDHGRPGDLIRCYPYPIGSYALGMDNRGLVSTFVREYTKTVEQVVEEFGGEDGRPLRQGAKPELDRFSDNVKRAWETKQYFQTVDIIWIVTPNHDYNDGALGARGMPFASCHFEKNLSATDDRFLRESGFREFPILAPRWFAGSEETYGTDCPGMASIGDIKQLQTMQKRKGQAIEKMVNPPLVGPPALRNQKTSLLSGDITYLDVREGQQGLKPIHEVKPDLQHFVLDIQATQYRVKQAFYVDLFLMFAQSDGVNGAQPVTAREVDERHEEKLLALGPVLESTIDELLDPLVDRVFAMMSRAGLIPQPPEELGDSVQYTVEYTSVLAQAMKLVGVAAQDRFTSTIMNYGQVDPRAIMKIRTFKLVDRYADQLGIDPEIIVSDEEAQAEIDQRQQAAQQAQQAATMESTAKAGKSLSETQMQGDTALNRILQNVTG